MHVEAPPLKFIYQLICPNIVNLFQSINNVIAELLVLSMVLVPFGQFNGGLNEITRMPSEEYCRGLGAAPHYKFLLCTSC
jgi:hypothetical protein